MTRQQWLRAVTRCGIAASSVVALAAAQTVETGFTSLFIGKDRNGWVYGRRAGNVENRTGKGYQVENGIRGTRVEFRNIRIREW